MSTFNGLLAHVLLVHGVVVLIPLTALLTVLCAVWPAARRRLTWLTLVLAAVSVVLIPITTDAGEWLEQRVGRTPEVHNHTQLGDTLIYFALGVLVAAVLVAFIHIRETRSRPLGNAVIVIVAVLAVAAGAAATVQLYRIGDSGARAVWGGVASITPEPRPGK